MKQGDIVTVKFPYTNFKHHKKRPALILSNRTFNKSSEYLLLAISTKANWPELSIALAPDSLQQGSLLKRSYIKFNNAMSFEKRLISKKIGQLNQPMLQKTLKKFYKLLKPIPT